MCRGSNYKMTKILSYYRDVDKFENRRKFCKNRRKGRRRHEQPQDARGVVEGGGCPLLW